VEQVAGVEETRKFNRKGNIDSEGSKVVVDVVKHAVGGVHLRVELSSQAVMRIMAMPVLKKS
jgi:hypothetical protein